MTNFALADNVSSFTNKSLELNMTPSLNPYGTCPDFRCSYIQGYVANITYHPPWSFKLGIANCSAYFYDGLTLDSSYWVQTCYLSWDATGDQVDAAILPVSVIKGLKLENQTLILSENEHYKTENYYLYIILIPSFIALMLLSVYVFYTEYWQPAHEE